EAELERRRQPLDDELVDRPREPVGEAEIPLRGFADEARKLYEERLIETELPRDAGRVLLRILLAEHDRDRIADIGEQREGDERHREHDQERLQEPPDDEGDHGGGPTGRERGNSTV